MQVAQLFMAHLAEHEAELLVWCPESAHQTGLERGAEHHVGTRRYENINGHFWGVFLRQTAMIGLSPQAARHNFRTLDRTGVRTLPYLTWPFAGSAV